MNRTKFQVLIYCMSAIFFLFSCQENKEKTKVTYYGKFSEVQITSIEPLGWLKKYLENQRDGLTGHLDENMCGYPFDNIGWADTAAFIDPASPFAAWYTYEQNGYWIDGMIRTGLLLNDKFLIDKANKSIDFILNHPAKDGFLGARLLREPYKTNRWVHTVFFRAIQAKYSATNNPDIPEILRRHYLSDIDSFPYTHVREVANIEHFLWVYSATGDKTLLEKAEKIYNEGMKLNSGRNSSAVEYNNLSKHAVDHGVTYNETAKLGAILYLYTGKEEYLQTSINAYRKIDEHHMMVDGVNSSTEILRGTHSLESHETCDISAFIWSNGYLLKATGNAEYADKIEKAAFNAATGCVTSDFKSLQYFSAPNQIVATRNSNHNHFFQGNTAMQFTSNSWVKCCPGEVNKIMPNYIARMWMKNEDGIVAATYGPSKITFEYNNSKISITEKTFYPFSDTITFVINSEKDCNFGFTLRIPGWCEEPVLFINGKQENIRLKPSSFFTLKRNFKNNDEVKLLLPQTLRLTNWPIDGVAVERGPLVYSLKVNEIYENDPFEGETPAKNQVRYNITTDSDWNYALFVNFYNIAKKVQVKYNRPNDSPWSSGNAPIELKVPAFKVRNWILDKRKTIFREDFYASEKKGVVTKWNIIADKIEGDFTFTPQIPTRDFVQMNLDTKEEMITLIPYGCTRLRITIFPQARYKEYTKIDF